MKSDAGSESSDESGRKNGTTDNRTHKQRIVDFVALIQLRDDRAQPVFHGHLHCENSQRGLRWTHDTIPKLEG